MDWTLLLSDLITPVATLGGVVLTLIYSGRRENSRLEKQLAAQREQLKISLADAQRARLHDQRVELFTRFLQVCVNVHFETIALASADPVRRLEMVPDVRKLRHQIREVGVQVVLLAPNLRGAANHTRSLLVRPKLGRVDESVSEWRIEANASINDLTRAMSNELGIDSINFLQTREGD